MLRKLLLVVVTWIAMIGFAFAAVQVDVNKADQAALDGVKGIGPKTSSAILDERKKGGNFKDWADLEKRVKGIGPKSAVRLSDAGLTVNGQTKSGGASSASASASASASGSADASASAKEGKKRKSKKDNKASNGE